MIFAGILVDFSSVHEMSTKVSNGFLKGFNAFKGVSNGLELSGDFSNVCGLRSSSFREVSGSLNGLQ